MFTSHTLRYVLPSHFARYKMTRLILLLRGTMELRKDPITRSWVVAGHPEREKVRPDPCPLCPENRLETKTLLDLPPQGKWQVRVYPHFRPLYRIEGEPGRSAEGIYDRMAAVGAHEIVVETPDHTRTLAQMSDEEIERVLDAYARASRI